MSRSRFGEFAGQFDVLGLAAGDDRAGLSEGHIPQANITEGFDRPDDLGEVDERPFGFFYPDVSLLYISTTIFSSPSGCLLQMVTYFPADFIGSLIPGRITSWLNVPTS